MTALLEKIIRNKEKEVTEKKKTVSPLELLRMAQDRPEPRSLSRQLRQSHTVGVIAEIKKASPSAGILREDFHPALLSQTYEKSGACAISVLTDERFFSGTLEYLAQVRQCVSLPILRKDFIIDPYQVVEALAYGADAILLILSVLSQSRCRELLGLAGEFKLDCLVEIHTPEELEIALALDADFIGINNRDLNSFRVDFSTTEKLIVSIPKDVAVVSESGIKSPEDVVRVGEYGVDAVLIGETFMRSSDVAATVKQFVGFEKWSR